MLRLILKANGIVYKYQLKSLDGDVEIGKISKQWSGLMKEWFTKADNFGVTCEYEKDFIIYFSHSLVHQ
jgi:hypothetical protein